MRNCGQVNVRKHREFKDSDERVTLNMKEIRGSDKCVTLKISEKFDSLNNMETTSSESKEKMKRSGKGLVTLWVSRSKQGRKNTKRQGMPSEMSV